jgi:hypothetical protein
MTNELGPGHVCAHGIRWPWACQTCDAEAWERYKREQREAAPGTARSMTNPYTE